MKESDFIYYTKINKGELHYVDALYINEKEHKILYVFESEPIDNLDIKIVSVSKKKMQKLLDKYTKLGYTLEKKDGAESRVNKERVIKALHLLYPNEILIPLSSRRVELFNYYNPEMVSNVLLSYQNKKVMKLTLEFWVKLYAVALQENYSRDDKILNSFYDAVIYELNNFVILTKREDDQSKIDKYVLNTLTELNIIDIERNRYLDKIRKKAK